MNYMAGRQRRSNEMPGVTIGQAVDKGVVSDGCSLTWFEKFEKEGRMG